jgi:hypothetical protein
MGKQRNCCWLTTRLKKETKNIAADKSLRKPALLDNRVFLPIDQENNAAEDHVDRGGEQGRGEQDEHALDDVGHQFPAAWLLRGR